MAQRFLSDIHSTAGFKDSSGDLGTNGQVLSSTGSGTNWVQAGSGATVIHDDQFTATAGQTAFTLSNTVDAENKTQVYIDGAYQAKAGYTVSGTTLTFDTGLDVGSKVEVMTFATAIASNATAVIKLDEFVPGDAISGTSGQNFTLSQTVSDEKVTQVYINGVYQHKDTYSISGTTLQFSSAPPSGSDIEVITFDTVVAADGTLSATTFLGDLNGTINTATTATTQSAGNNSTKISTTAYADAKVADAINNGTTAIAPSQNAVFDALALKSNIASPTFTGTPAAPTASAGTNTTQLATTAFVTTGIANIVDSSPAALNTLNELAAALGDDANFSTTVTNSIATKAPLASPSFTGNATFASIVGIGSTGIFAGTNAILNLQGSGIALKNDRNGSNNNWSYIQNDGTGSDSTIVFGTGQALQALKLSHSGLLTLTVASSTNPRLVFAGADVSGTHWMQINRGTSAMEFYVNGATRATIGSGGDVTLNGNGTTSALLFGQSSFARIINTSGQILYVDSDTHEFRTSGGVGKLSIASTGETIYNSGGFIDFDGQSLQLNTQRNPNSGVFNNTSKSNASIGLNGASGGSSIIFRTAAANNTTATTRLTISSGGTATFVTTENYTTSGFRKYIVLDAASQGGGGIIWSKQSSTYNRGILVNQGTFMIVRSTADDNSAALLTDLVVDPNGKVGIGNTSPSGKLHLTSSGGADGLRVNAGTSSSNNAIIVNNEADNATLFYVRGNGDGSFGGSLTIGGAIDNPFKITANPGTRALKLVSASSGSSTNKGTFISWLRDGESYEKAYLGFTSTSDDVFEINNRENADMTFHTNTSERLRISSTGNVGINVTPASTRTLLVKGQGTSSSTAAFQVNDGNNADILVITDDKNATFSGNLILTGSASNLNFSSSQDASITMSATSSGTDGRDLSIFAGASSSNASDNGGDLILRGGNAGANGSSQIRFRTATASHAYGITAEQMRIDSVGDVNITNNLFIGSGKALYVGGTSAANGFDDYEEGSWTPSLSTSGGSVGTSSSAGQYTKIGRQVIVHFQFTLSSSSGGSGTLKITNLPFSVDANSGAVIGAGRILDLGQTINVGHFTSTNQIGMFKYNGNYAGTDFFTNGFVTYFVA